ncbi:PREDICTED: uncharacterized protein LOC108970909, partial [Bactrocera latifrons]|uniref:uncharacterized protein LOC108970909 n=1 Tax=Bactrocera latifrons TaxID=174628 RepID=UPI0008DE5293
MSGGSQIKTTITTAVTRTEMSHIHDTAYDKDSQKRNAPKVTIDDALNTENLKGRGDVKRKIIELENAKNIMPISAIGKQKSLAEIGEKIPAVKEVVKDFEDKLQDYSVETTPFKVRQRDSTPAHVDESVLERQILTDVDLALENLISHEPPAQEVKLSPVTAIETRLDNSDVPNEEICEKVCMKRKMFEVAKEEIKSVTTDEADPMEKSPKAIDLPSADSEDSGILPNVKDVVKTFEQKFASLQSSPLPARKQVVRADNEVDITYLGEQGLSQTDEILETIAGSALPEHGEIMTQARLGSSLGKEQVEQFSDPLVKKQIMSEINRDYGTSLVDQNTPNDNKIEVVSKVTDEPQAANNANDFIETICDKTEFPIGGTNVIDNSSFPMTDKEDADSTFDKQDTDITSIKKYKLKIYETIENERELEVCLGNLKQRKYSVQNVKSSDETSTIKRFPVPLSIPISVKNETKKGINKIESSSKEEQNAISCEHLNINQLKLKTFSRPPVPLTMTNNIEWTDEKIKRLKTSDPHILPKQKDFRITSEKTELMTTEDYISSEHQNNIFHQKAITKENTDNTLDEKIEHKINFRDQTNTIKDQTSLLHTLSTLESKSKDTDFKDVQPEEKYKFSLDIVKPVFHVYSSEEIEEDYNKHMVTDMKQVFPLEPFVGKQDDIDTKDVHPISKPVDKPKSPLDIAKPVPHVYSSDESEVEFDKPKVADMKQVSPLIPILGKPDDKGTKETHAISIPVDKPKSPLDIVKPVTHVYSSDESEVEFDKSKVADMKQTLPLVPSVGKPDDKDTKGAQP